MLSTATRVVTGARSVTTLVALVAVAGLAMAVGSDEAATASSDSSAQDYVNVPMPSGFRVVQTELEGPVFADAQGRTLYAWPQGHLPNGYAGEQKGIPGCYEKVSTETTGLISPYPPGVVLPELDKRLSCAQMFPPVLAPDGAKEVGKWTVVDRKDGKKQWAYDEQPLYTSIRDRRPGDVLAGTARSIRIADHVVMRVPIAPPPLVPPGFAVKTTVNGRLLTTYNNYTVYTLEDESACDATCMNRWKPLVAPDTARPIGEWTMIPRSPGVRQWAFRNRPLYTFEGDSSLWSLEGNDEPGWRSVYVQQVWPVPAEFTVQDTLAGQVLADERGRTIYTYFCIDPSPDQFSCDMPEDTQVYRLAVCGAGDVQQCLCNWPYVIAKPGAKSDSTLWSVMSIDPATGHRAQPGQSGALSVWAYRERPVYTYIGDRQPGDVNGASTGEGRGRRNGLKAFWIRDDFFDGAL